MFLSRLSNDRHSILCIGDPEVFLFLVFLTIDLCFIIRMAHDLQLKRIKGDMSRRMEIRLLYWMLLFFSSTMTHLFYCFMDVLRLQYPSCVNSIKWVQKLYGKEVRCLDSMMGDNINYVISLFQCYEKKVPIIKIWCHNCKG